MHDFYLDDVDTRAADARRESRAERRRICADERLPPLERIIETCKERGDRTFHPAFAFWIASLSNRGTRFNRSVPRYVKIPDILREACGLSSQNVLLEPTDDVWTLVSGKKAVLLYSPS